MKLPGTWVWMAFAILLAPQVHAHTFIYNLEDGTPMFRASFPDGWRLDLDFEPKAEDVDAPPPPRVVEAIPKDGSKLWLGMWVVTEIEDVGEAGEFFESLEQYVLSDVEITDSNEEDLNGMPARYFSGTAKKGREPVEWAIVLFQAKPRNISALLYIGVPEAREQRREELSGIVDSILPVAN